MAAPDAETLHRQLVEKLVVEGTLTEDWQAAFEAVPRHAFIPDLTWHRGTANGRWGLIPRRRAEDPDGWLSVAYQDDSVITQVDDGEPGGPDGTGVVPTSSASMPTVVVAMLRALDVHDGQRVLEIGTGTGYNAAPDDGAGELWFLDSWSGSWASHFHVTPDCSDDEFSVRQRGPRRLWDEISAAHTWCNAAKLEAWPGAMGHCSTTS